MKQHVRRLVNHDRCVGPRDESPKSRKPGIIVHRIGGRDLAASDDLAPMSSLDATDPRMVVRIVVGQMAVTRREVSREPACVHLIEGRGEANEVLLRCEGDHELAVLITDAPLDSQHLAERLDGVRRPLEQRPVPSDLVGRQITQDLEPHRAMTLKVGELPPDLGDPSFRAVLRPAVKPDLDRWSALDLIHRNVDEPESTGGEQHDEHGETHARVVGRKPRRLDGLPPILHTRGIKGFKCAVERSDTSEVGFRTGTYERRPGARWRRWLPFILCSLVTTAIADRLASAVAPPHPARWESLEGPRVPVAGAAGVMLERGPALIGGFTELLEATAAIQVRDSRHGWMPVGSSLLEARAEASVMPLGDGTVLVVGGWNGRLPDQVRHLGTAERLDPWNPATRISVPPPLPDRVDAGLEGHAICALSDGRVMLVHGRRGTIFDPADDSWSTPFRLACERHDAGLVEVRRGPDDPIEVVAIGGGRRDDDPPIETVRIEADGTATSTPWPDSAIPATIGRLATLPVGREILVAGGENQGRSVASTFRLDPAKRSVTSGADLPVATGVAGGRLIRAGARVVLLGGESLVEGRPVPVPSGTVLHPRLDRVWPLPTAPAASVRSTVLGGDGASPEVVGGYRFDAHAGRGARTRVLADDLRLRLPSLLIDD